MSIQYKDINLGDIGSEFIVIHPAPCLGLDDRASVRRVEEAAQVLLASGEVQAVGKWDGPAALGDSPIYSLSLDRLWLWLG